MSSFYTPDCVSTVRCAEDPCVANTCEAVPEATCV